MELRNHAADFSGQDLGQYYDSGQLLAQTEVYGTNVFTDVSSSSPSLAAIEAMYRAGITSGCTAAPAFCPASSITRQQMAVFIERAIHGKRQGVTYVAAPQAHNLQDVATALFKDYAVKSYVDGVILACGSNANGPLFCPDDVVTRSDMAGMLLRARYGWNYVPTAGSTARFADVPIGHPQRAWIEQLAVEGITLGCDPTDPTKYCPDAAVTREQMPLFLARNVAFIPNTTPNKYFTYFGVAEVSPGLTVSSITETGPHINLVHTMGWGNWSTADGVTAIMNNVVWQLKEARRHGVVNSMVSTDFLVFLGTGQFGNKAPFDPRATSEIISNLRTFFDLLRAEQVLHRVASIYVVDEPRDEVGITEEETELAAALNRQVLGEYYMAKSAKLAVIYEKNKYTAPHAFDWLGVDDYAAGESVLYPGGAYDGLKAQLDLSRQKTILVPGGSNGSYWSPVLPWVFKDKLVDDPDVVLMNSFIWFDKDDDDTGVRYLGIRSNGMRVPYCLAGTQVRGVATSVCN